MAVASVNRDDKVNDWIDFIDLPCVDLDDFGGDELRLVAQFSGHFPQASFSDIVVPKIDRSCFNESAGSRKQTWTNRGSSHKHSNRGWLGSSATTSTALLQRSGIGLTSTTVQSHSLTPNGKVTVKSSVRQVAWTRAISTNVAVDEKFATNGEIQGPLDGVAGIVRETLSRKRQRQPIEAFKDDKESEEEIARTRNEKRSRSSVASKNLEEGVLVGAKRSRGPLFGARQLEFYQRPERAQKRCIREGDLMEQLAKMKGKWACREKTRKIVDASGFPVGWTVRVGLSYKDGRTLFEYRDWRSPDGTLWSSFQDASAFLLSSIGHDSTSKIVVLVKPGGGTIGEEGIFYAKEENSSETVEKGYVQGGYCTNKVPRVDWDQAAGGCSNVDKTPNFTLAAARVETASHVDELKAEDCYRGMLNEGQTQESWQSAFLLQRDSCGDLIIKTDDSSKHADLKESPRISDRTANSALAAAGVEMESYVDGLQAEDCHRERFNIEQTQESGQLSCLLETHSCGDHMTKPEDPSKNADLKESPRISNHESTSGGIESSINLGHSKITEGQCFSHLKSSIDSGHSCPSCGMMFSTLLKLRGHLRRAKNGRRFNCDVCGKHFSSPALLLSHRVQMGHPRVTRMTSESRRLQAKGLEPVSRPRDSKSSKIVLGLLCDDSGGVGGNVDHASVAAKSSFKSTENLIPRDVLKIVNKEVGRAAEKNGDLSGVFECETCNKVFYRRSQYWGHQSVHSKQRKKALKSSVLSESISERSLDRLVGPESNLQLVVRENCGYEAGHKYSVENVLWRLLDDSSPLKSPNHELDIFQDEAVRPPVLHSKEEVTSEIGVLTY